MLQMQGRQFQPEKVFHGDRRESSAGWKADWTRGATENPVTNVVSLTLERVLNLLTRNEKPEGFLYSS